MRDAGPAHHVVDADAVEAAVLELDHARLQQPADGFPALRTQFTVLSGAPPPREVWRVVFSAAARSRVARH